MPLYATSTTIRQFQNMGRGANGSLIATAGANTGPHHLRHFDTLYLGRIPRVDLVMPARQNDVSNVGVSAFVDLATVIAGVGTIAANLTVSRALQASITGTSTVGPSLKVSRSLAAVVAGSSTIQSGLKVTRRLAAVIAGTSSITADLTVGAGGVLRSLAAAITGSSTVQAGLSVARRLSASVSGTSTVSPNMTVSRRMSTIVSGAAQILAALSIVGSIPTPVITQALLRRRRLLRQSGAPHGRKRRNW